jgi:hypothetical protein
MGIFSTFIDADAKAQSQNLKAMFPDFKGNFGAFSPRALMPVLNDFGEIGWEMIACHPYTVGDNLDVMTHNVAGAGTFVGNKFTHNYFCVFKRRKQTA